MLFALTNQSEKERQRNSKQLAILLLQQQKNNVALKKLRGKKNLYYCLLHQRFAHFLHPVLAGISSTLNLVLQVLYDCMFCYFPSCGQKQHLKWKQMGPKLCLFFFFGLIFFNPGQVRFGLDNFVASQSTRSFGGQKMCDVVNPYWYTL